MQTETTEKPALKYLSVLAAAIVIALAVFALLPVTPVAHPAPVTDSAIFQFIGRKILEGKLPFRDVYDHKPPLIFYLNALGLWLGRGGQWGIWAIELISLSAAGLFGFSILKRYFGRLPALAAITAMLLGLSYIMEYGNLTEEYALPFQFAAIFLLDAAERAKKPAWLLFGVGVMLGMASTLKQPLAGIGLSIAIYLFARYILLGNRQRKLRALFQSYLWIALGAIAVWLAWFAYFAAAGIFPDFWEAAFAYNVALSNITTQKRLESLLFVLNLLMTFRARFFLAGMVFWFAVLPYLLFEEGILAAIRRSGAGAQFPRQGSRGWLLPLVIALIDLPVSLVFASLSGNNYRHYLMALLPSLAILMAFGFALVLTALKQTVRQPLASIWVLALLLPTLQPDMAYFQTVTNPRVNRQVAAVAAYIRANTQPGDGIQEWGVAAPVYLLSGRESPSRFFFTDPLFVEGYSGKEKVEQFLRDLRANPPVLLIDEGMARLPWVSVKEGDSCAQVRDPQYYQAYTRQRFPGEIDLIPPVPTGISDVYAWVCENYTPLGPVGPLAWNVYRLKGK